MKNYFRFKTIFFSLITIFFLSFSINLLAQKADSILSVLKKHRANDTIKVTMFSEIANYYLDRKIDSTIHFASEGLALARQINFGRGEAKCKQLLGSAHLQKSEYNDALYFFKDAFNVYERSDDKQGESNCLRLLGNTYYRQSKYDSSFICYNKSILLSEQINDKKNIGLLLMDIGIIYNDLGDYPKALDYYQKALKKLEAEKYSYGVSLCLSNMALLYSALGDFKKAIDYNDQCRSIYEKSGDRVGILSAIVNAGVIYGQSKDYENALRTFKTGYLLANSIGETYSEKLCRSDIAQANYYLGNYDTALALYNDALAESENANEQYNIATIQNGIGNVLIKKSRIQEGINHLLIAFNIAQKNGIKELASQCAADLSSAYENVNDFQSALRYNKINYDYRDSVFSEKNDKLIHQLQFDDEIGKKDNQIKLLEKDEVIRRKISETAIVILVMAIIIAALLFMYYKKSRKNLHEVTMLKEELEKKNLEQDRIMDAVAHDLRSPISGIASLAGLLLRQEGMPVTMNKSISMIITTSQSALTLINELMSYRNETQDVLNKEEADVVKLTEEMVLLLALKATEKQQRLSANSPQSSIIASIDREKIKRVLANIIGNAMKFTPAGGTIDVTITKNERSVLISVKDAGIGIPKKSQGAVFDLFTESKRKGTQGEKSYGLGLSIARQIVNTHGGKIFFQSEEGRGTTFYVELPIL